MPEREKTFRCLACEDQGVVFVVHPDTAIASRRERDEFFEHGVAYSACAKCTCHAGAKRPESWPLFDGQKMVIWTDDMRAFTGRKLRIAIANAVHEHMMTTCDFTAQFT